MRIAFLTTDNREPFLDHANPRPWFGTAPEALLQGFAQLPDVEVHVVSCLRQPAPAPEKLAENIWYHSLVVPKWGWMTTGFQGCIRAVRRKLREIQPDLVHGQGTEREAAMAAVFSGRPNVLTLHGNMRSVARALGARPFSYNWLAARLEAFVLPRTDGVVCISNYTRQAVNGLARRTWLLPNAVDAAFFAVERAPASPPVVLCVANVCDYKNQNGLIQALDEWPGERPFVLRFLGAAAEHTPYGREFLNRVRARSWCEWPGPVGREQLRTELARATAVILPSLEDNCPMVVLEAMAAGVPVLGARIGGIPDLIAPGRTGLLFDPRAPAAMRDALAHCLRERGEVEQWAATARAEALARFHPRVIARKHLDIYREVLQNHRPRQP
ncbi:MAG: glycosyltransferase family 4 protein [Limisphaerales bacterium]